MSLDIGDALRDGAARTVERTGLLLMAGFAAIGFASLLARQSFLAWYLDFAARVSGTSTDIGATPVGLAFDLPVGVSVGMLVVLALVAEAFRVVAVRTMVGDHTDTIPGSVARRNLPLATLNGFVGGIVVAVLVGIASLALVVPGIFLGISFMFVRQEIAVQDENFVEAMVNSWELTSGNRVELAVLGVVWVAIALVLFVVNLALSMALPPGSPVTPLVATLLGVPVTVFVVATAARAYVQLAGEDAGTVEDDGGTDDDEEWPDPPGVDV